MNAHAGVLVIAEAGVNHNGDLDIAKALVAAAAGAGADYVKFQTFVADEVVAADAPKARYQQRSGAAGESQRDMIRRLELSLDDHLALIAECERHGIGFLSTAFDLASFDLLMALGLPLVKVPSGEITNLPLLRRMGAAGKPMLMSTGMATLEEIADALRVVAEAGTPRASITLLHCNTAYPTPMGDANLRAIATLREAFATQVGYSDHTLGIEAPLAAVALGAMVIEKHFTLDRDMEGPDHAASLLPSELAAMVAAIRNIEQALGDGVKRPTASELENRDIARRSIVAARPIRAGETFSADNLAAKRPATGLSPMRWDDVVGRVATRDYAADEAIEP